MDATNDVLMLRADSFRNARKHADLQGQTAERLQLEPIAATPCIEAT